jgi:predicted thioredoxin/glutaredoxin
MSNTIQNIINLSKQFEKIAVQSLASFQKRKRFSLLEELEMQLLDAQRTGDEDWVRELKERIKEIKSSKN